MVISRRQFLGGTAALLGSGTLCRAQTLTADGFIEIRAQPVTLGLLEGGGGKTGAWLFGMGPEPAVIRARQGQELPQGGVLGRWVWTGTVAPLLPWLLLGQWLHVGKGATAGLGGYRVLPLVQRAGS